MSLVVVRAIGMISVQDLGRPGHMHEGLAPGGALVPELLVAANRATRTADGAAAFEVMGQLVVRAERELTVAVDEHARVLHPGEELTVTNGDARVAYLAVHGGIDAPLVLGSRSTQLSAGLGAFVRTGDRVPVGRVEHRSGSGLYGADPARHVRGRGPIRVVPGPDVEAFATEALYGSSFTISPASDRVGTRLVGPKLARRTAWREQSRPMVRGAIEVPGDGQPIVLGPEHPTTGGYPVIAVVAHADLGALFALPLGATVTFRRC
jgi:allophanate hydrolase subunit 2